MNSKVVILAAIVSAALGCVLFIIAIASTAWISGCMSYGDLMNEFGNMLSMDDPSPSVPPVETDGGGSIFGDSFENEGFPMFEKKPVSGEKIPNSGDAFSNMSDGSKDDIGGAIFTFPTLDIQNLDIGSYNKNGIPNTGDNFSDIGGNVKNAMDALGAMKTCISQGLFKMSLNAAGVMDTSVGINVSTLPAAVIVGAVGIAISLLLGAIGVIVLITASAGNTDSYQHKGKVANRTGVGMILLVLACTFGVIGMSCYTGGSEQEIHNPMILMMRLGLSISQAFGQTPAVPDGTDLGYMADVAMLDESGSMGDIMKSLHAVFTLHYSYAFIMAWIAAVLLIVAAILSAIAKQELINQRHMGGANVAL